MSQSVVNSIADTIGNTPLLRVSKLTDHPSTFAKLEYFNPGSSVKDRLALGIIRAAEQSGALSPGGTIVEGTSGNTGIALAMLGAALGYRVVIVMPETMSLERRQIIQAYGADLVLTPGTEGMRGAVSRAMEIVNDTPGAVAAHQFKNEANAAMHRATTGPELISALDGNVDVVVAGIGTGGTITGVTQALQDANISAHIVAVEPSDSPLLSEGQAGPHKIQGIGANFVPDVLDQSLLSEVITVQYQDALDTARRLMRTEGVFAGISAGASMWAALQVGNRPEFATKNIAVIVPDTAERYLSTPLFTEQG